MQILGIIPARYASTRFPGKPLAEIAGKSLIERVYSQARKAQKLHKLIVATDDTRILAHVQAFGGQAVMTSLTHPSGTDRCAEVAEMFPEFEVCLNIQGDEPFINPTQIDLLASLFEKPDTQIATLIMPITKAEDIFSEKEIKVVFNSRMQTLYMSRSPIPFLRDVPPEQWIHTHTFYKHIGLYGYRREILLQIAQLPPNELERCENLEQLRWLAHFPIQLAISHEETLSIDTPQDLEKATEFLANKPS
ncbi:MAG: 3-deoxy-manno-octulosonate cytidylyltransferase [Microscillaceae bacterium]|nr:3-deoxy-manno-octulosonate cytidylyltransferase [Microscillaceae bacterium]